MLHGFEKGVEVEEVGGEQNEESDYAGGRPDDDGCAAADGREIKQEGERQGHDDDHGELGADGDGEGDAEQDDAAPVPENDFARGVESVGDGDGGEDGTERSPGGEDFRLGVPDGAGLDHRGRKAVEREGEEAAGIAAETAGNIPERSAEEDSEGRNGMRGSQRQWESLETRLCGQASRGAAVTSERAGSVEYRSRRCRERFPGKAPADREVRASGNGAPAIGPP